MARRDSQVSYANPIDAAIVRFGEGATDWRSYEGVAGMYLGFKLPALGKAYKASTVSTAEYAYRFDTRPLSEIRKAGGFNAWGEDMNLLEHAGGFTIKNKTSGYVSTLISLNVAQEFAENSEAGGYIYKILKPKTGIDVNRRLGSPSPFPSEREIAVPNRIPANKIKSVTPVESN